MDVSEGGPVTCVSEVVETTNMDQPDREEWGVDVVGGGLGGDS